jgi:enolase
VPADAAIHPDAFRAWVADLDARLRGYSITDQAIMDHLIADAPAALGTAAPGRAERLALSLAVARAGAVQASMPLARYLGGTTTRLLPVPHLTLWSGARQHHGLATLRAIPFGLEDPTALLTAVRGLQAAWQSVLQRRLGERIELERLTAGAIFALAREALEMTDLRLGQDVGWGIGVAGESSYLGSERYRGLMLDEVDTLEARLTTLETWVEEEGVLSIDDVCAGSDLQGWAYATRRLGDRAQLVLDRAVAGDATRFMALQEEVCGNAVVIELGDFATVTDAALFAEVARHSACAVVVGQRRPGGQDGLLAELAMGWHAGQMRLEHLTRGDHLDALNQVARAAGRLGGLAVMAGPLAFAPRVLRPNLSAWAARTSHVDPSLPTHFLPSEAPVESPAEDSLVAQVG